MCLALSVEQSYSQYFRGLCHNDTLFVQSHHTHKSAGEIMSALQNHLVVLGTLSIRQVEYTNPQNLNPHKKSMWTVTVW